MKEIQCHIKNRVLIVHRRHPIDKVRLLNIINQLTKQEMLKDKNFIEKFDRVEFSEWGVL